MNGEYFLQTTGELENAVGLSKKCDTARRQSCAGKMTFTAAEDDGS